jgi:hypothetical protein
MMIIRAWSNFIDLGIPQRSSCCSFHGGFLHGLASLPTSNLPTSIISHGTADCITTLSIFFILSLSMSFVMERFLRRILADRFGRFNVFIIAIACFAVNIVLGNWFPCNGSKMLLLHSVAFEVGSGINFSLRAPYLSKFCEL